MFLSICGILESLPNICCYPCFKAEPLNVVRVSVGMGLLDHSEFAVVNNADLAVGQKLSFGSLFNLGRSFTHLAGKIEWPLC